jgi:ABC-2 type transport system permease protein
MGPAGTIRLIAGREVRQRLRSRLFVWTTVGLSVLFVLLSLLPLLVDLLDVGPDPEAVPDAMPVAVVGKLSPSQRVALATVLGELDERSAPDEPAAVELIEQEEAVLAIVDGERVLEPPPDSVLQLGGDRAAEVAQALAVAAVLDDAGMDAGAVDDVLAVPALPVEVVGPYDPGQQVGQLIMANLGVVFLFAVLTLYATLIVNGIIEEKGSRVVEVLVETVPVRQLMAGKLLGLGAIGLGQTLVLFGPATAMLLVAGTLELPAGGLGPLLLILAWFLAGYAFYSVVAAALGSLVSRPEEAQAVLTPASLLMVAGYLIGFFSINAPDGGLAVIAGWIPPAAPYVMLVRQLLGDPAPYEVIGAVLVMVVVSAMLAAVASRVYEGGILRTRARLRLRDAWRAARE